MQKGAPTPRRGAWQPESSFARVASTRRDGPRRVSPTSPSGRPCSISSCLRSKRSRRACSPRDLELADVRSAAWSVRRGDALPLRAGGSLRGLDGERAGRAHVPRVLLPGGIVSGRTGARTRTRLTVIDLASGAKTVVSSDDYESVAFAPDGDGLVAAAKNFVHVFRRASGGRFTRQFVPGIDSLHLDAAGAFVTVDGERISLHEPTTGAAVSSIDMTAHVRAPARLAHLPPPAAKQILNAWRLGRYIEAIKDYRAAAGAGLRDAKTVVDSIESWCAARAAGSRVVVTHPRNAFLFDRTGSLLARGGDAVNNGQLRKPVPSPNGRRIAYVDSRRQNEKPVPVWRSTVSVRDVEPSGRWSSGIETLISNDYVSPSLAWAPSGRRLAFVAPRCVRIIEPSAASGSLA